MVLPRIYLHEVPESLSVDQFILQTTDIVERFNLLHKKRGRSKASQTTYVEAPVHHDFDSFRRQVMRAIDEFGLRPFRYGPDGPVERPAYESIGLTYNPDSIDAPYQDPHFSSLGSERLQTRSYQAEAPQAAIKNTYLDSYACSSRTPIADRAGLKEFLQSFRHPLVRSRISKLYGNRPESQSHEFGWHSDEPIFLNLRVNVPLVTTADFVLQVQKKADSGAVEELALREGFAYVYNTGLKHRVVCERGTDVDRVNLIVGVTPWFRFDADQKFWEANEFYGKVHPFEMFENGLISSLISKKLS